MYILLCSYLFLLDAITGLVLLFSHTGFVLNCQKTRMIRRSTSSQIITPYGFPHQPNDTPTTPHQCLVLTCNQTIPNDDIVTEDCIVFEPTSQVHSPLQIHMLSFISSLPVPECMNPITSLPIIQRHNLFHCQEGNEQCEKHNHPLHSHVLHPNKHMRHKSQQQAHNRVQKPNRKTLSPKLHTRPLIKEYKFAGIVPIGQKHGHFPNYIMHSARHTEEIDKHSTSQPNLRIMKQCLAGQNLLHNKRRPHQEGRHKESQLLLGEHRRPLDWADGERRRRGR
ncbi:unnamed protein product, partial [Vitis vinifera]